MVGSVVVRDVIVVTRVKILQFDPKGQPLFEMSWFYMGIAQIALDLFSTFSGPYFFSVFFSLPK